VARVSASRAAFGSCEIDGSNSRSRSPAAMPSKDATEQARIDLISGESEPKNPNTSASSGFAGA
jgi:hypothetical protein